MTTIPSHHIQSINRDEAGEIESIDIDELPNDNLRTLIETYTLMALNMGSVPEEQARKLARITAIAVVDDMEAEHPSE